MPLELAWSRVGGDHGLRITGWSPRDREALTRLAADRLAERILVLPTSLVGDSVDETDAPLATTRLARASGRFTADADGVTFVPKFPFLARTSYTVLVHPSLCGEPDGNGPVDVVQYHRFAIAAREASTGATTRVVAIHPAGASVPRNLLRCYVQFSAPMSEGEASTAVQLVDRNRDEPIEGAFLAMDPELWDPARTRLTVLLDPARIKRGLAPHREAGYALAEGAEVSLVVGRDFRDADGRPLVDPVEHHYRVGPDVRGRVDPSRWQLDPPRAGSRDALVVGFDRPLDHALLTHCLAVAGGGGGAVAGRATPTTDCTAWSFTPAEPWPPVRHDLVADAMLEDVAGNSVVRVFDRDLDDAAQSPIAVGPVTREFTPRV